MKAMILAAGLGTRLRPITWTTPKPMVPLCNRPLVGWAVESLLAAGVSDLIVNLHHLPYAIERYLHERYAARATLHFSFEPEILGTGGALKRVRALLERDQEFLLVNGDTVQFPLYAELVAARRARGSVAALTLRHPPPNDRFTSVWLDGGRVTGFGEGTGEPLMFAGSHCISPRLFGHFPSAEVFGIVDRVYQPLLEEGRETIAGAVDDGTWFDIGTPVRYLAANEALLDAITRGAIAPPAGSSVRADSLAADDAIVTGRVTRSSVGARTRLEGDVADSIVGEDCVIGPGVRIRRCIVGAGIEVRSPLDASDAVLCRDDAATPRDLTRHGGVVFVPIHATP